MLICPSIHIFLVSFDEILYGGYATAGHPKFLQFDFLQSVTTIPWVHKLVRWEEHWCHFWNTITILIKVTIITKIVLHIVNIFINAIMNSLEHLECQGAKNACESCIYLNLEYTYPILFFIKLCIGPYLVSIQCILLFWKVLLLYACCWNTENVELLQIYPLSLLLLL
jgi:hypothetical protein